MGLPSIRGTAGGRIPKATAHRLLHLRNQKYTETRGGRYGVFAPDDGTKIEPVIHY